MQEKDLELRRTEAASTEQLKRQELEVKRLEITEQNKREKQEVIQLKRYADALRGVLHPQPADPCGLPLYFENLERMYKQFDVPAKLQASLLIPYLNTSTQMMITRLPASDLENYTKLKTFILAQHKLSSKDYKQRFSHAMCHVLFVSHRLRPVRCGVERDRITDCYIFYRLGNMLLYILSSFMLNLLIK